MEENRFMSPINKIQKNLYLGNLIGARNQLLLRQLHIEAIVQVLDDMVQVPRFQNIDYYYINIYDLPCEDITQHIPGVVNFINQQISNQRRVFVHCSAGISRSTSIILAFLMVKYDYSYEQALETVKISRRCACPNIGFARQLKELDIENVRQQVGLNLPVN